jgi:glycosyltransferase involved in cell wall biosynthesis
VIEAGPRPVISVVMPVRDMETTIGGQLGALARQDFTGPWELVVADNGSGDASAATAARWQDRLPIRVVDAAGPADCGYARNLGVALSSGDLLAFCDADDEVRPGWLRAVVGALESSPLVTGPLDYAKLNPPALAARHAGADPGAPSSGFLPAGPGCNLAMRRSVFDELGGFPEGLRRGEDTVFCWRAQLAGHQLSVARAAIVDRRLRNSPRDVFIVCMVQGMAAARKYELFRRHGMPRPTSPLRDLVYDCLRIPVYLATRRWVRAADAAGWRLGCVVGSIRLRFRCR